MSIQQLNILYLYPSRAFTGASKSLIEQFKKLKIGGVTGTVVCPVGRASEQFERAGMCIRPVFGLSQFDNTRFGYYRGMRWLVLLREFPLLPASFLGLLKIRFSQNRFDLIHLNEITLLPLGVVAKYILRLPLVVHVRSVQRSDNGCRSRWIHWILGRHADAVICIDETVKQSLPSCFPCDVIHNGLVLPAGTAHERIDSSNIVTLGYVGSLLRLKGAYELLEAVRILSVERSLQLKLLLFGENVRRLTGIKAWLMKRLRFNDDVAGDIEKFIAAHDLQNVVELKGFESDVSKIYTQIDILCFTSHLNAAGRPVFEAACFGIPSVVAMDTPLEDTIQHEVTGLVIERPEPQLIADALARLVQDESLRQRLGENARAWSQQYFDIEHNAKNLYRVYERLAVQQGAAE